MLNKSEKNPSNKGVPMGTEIGSKKWKEKRKEELNLKLTSLRGRIEILKKGNRPESESIIMQHENEIKEIERKLEKFLKEDDPRPPCPRCGRKHWREEPCGDSE